MDTFFLEYRDPLFSVIIFFVFIFIITFISYWWGKFIANKDNKHLDNFLKQFHTKPSSHELKILIDSGDLSEKSWLILAQAYFDKGEYTNTIEIYTQLLKLQKQNNSKEILFLLGTTYLKAGFLQRAKTVFLEILKNNPRTPEVLQHLLLVYEQMRDYKSALDVLIPLEELGCDISTQASYLKVMVILNDVKLTSQEKVDKLIDIYLDTHQNTHLIFEYLFKINPKKAFKYLNISKSELLLDIFWLVDIKDLNLDIITKNNYLMELYTARGDLNLSKRSDVFEFDVLINLNKEVDATLSFEYVCDRCKQTSPFSFSRCSKCHGVDTLVIEMNLIKDYYRNFNEENNSFQ